MSPGLVAATAALLRVSLHVTDASLSGHPHSLFDIVKEEFQCTHTNVPAVMAVYSIGNVSYSTVSAVSHQPHSTLI